MALPSTTLRTCTKCESEVPLIENHPNDPWEFDIEAFLFDETDPETWRQVDEIIKTEQLDWKFPPAFVGNRISFVPRTSPTEAGPSRLLSPGPDPGPYAPSQPPISKAPISVLISGSVPNSLVDDSPSNSPSSQPVGTTPSPLQSQEQSQEQSPHPDVPLVNRPVITQKPSGVKRPAGPPLPNAQPQKRQKQQPPNDTPKAGILLPPTTPPAAKGIPDPQVSGVKRPAPVLPGSTQSRKRQQQQPPNVTPNVGMLLPPSAPPAARGIPNPQISEVKRQPPVLPRKTQPRKQQKQQPLNNIPKAGRLLPPTAPPSAGGIPNLTAPVLPANTQPQKQQKNQHQNNAIHTESLRRNATLAENRANAYAPREVIQQRGQTPAAASPENIIPTTTSGSAVPINPPHAPSAGYNSNVPNPPTEREKRVRHKTAKREEQLRRKALLAKNRAEAYPQLEPAQQNAWTPTTAEPSQPPEYNIPTAMKELGASNPINHPPNANLPLPTHNQPQVSQARIQPPTNHPATSQIQQDPINPGTTTPQPFLLPPTAPPSAQPQQPLPSLPPQNSTLQSHTTLPQPYPQPHPQQEHQHHPPTSSATRQTAASQT